MHKDTGSEFKPQYSLVRLGVEVHTCNPSTGGRRILSSRSAWAVSKKKGRGKEKGKFRQK
jgi:ABC-type sulfate transport system substrate-binding protein